MITKQGYELIAAAFADTAPRADTDPTALAYIAEERAYIITVLAARLKAQNPRFDVAKFKAACGQQEA